MWSRPNANPGDGQFSGGKALPAEQLPSSLSVDDISFTIGSKADHAKNAVAAAGQKIALPAGTSKVYILAAADSDTVGTFKVGSASVTKSIQAWTGYVGQWDNRLWSAKQNADFQNYGEMAGLVPAYVKGSEVAWFASHSHKATGNTFYEYAYLYKYGFNVPAGPRL